MGNKKEGDSLNNIQTKHDEYESALEDIKKLTKGSSNGEIFKIHEIVKKVLKKFD